MLNHTVFFWLKKDLAPAQRAGFEAALRGLLTIPGAKRGVVGRPGKTAARPVVDHSYDFALEIEFTNVAEHDRYQDHALHTAFLEGQRSKWERVVVYDFEHEP